MTGGVDTRFAGIDIRSRDPFRALVLSLALFLLQGVTFRGAFIADLEWARERLVRWGAGLAAAAGALLAAYAIVFGSFAVGGADSYGYVSQAYAWVSGELPAP